MLYVLFFESSLYKEQISIIIYSIFYGMTFHFYSIYGSCDSLVNIKRQYYSLITPKAMPNFLF